MFLEAFMGNAHLHSLQAGPLFQKRVVRSSPYSIAEWLGIPDEYFDSWNGDFSGDEEEVHRPSTNQSNKLDCREDDIEFELSLREIDTDEYEHVNPKRMFNKISNQEYKTDERKLQGGYHKIRQYIRKQMTCQDMMTTYRAKQINNIWRLQPVDRWRLYRLWVAQYVANLFNIIAELHKCYHYESELLRELRNDENKYLLRNAKVVGMTTTGAGKYRDLLQELQPRIVIVEEAAEVLEAHIVTSLAINTEHLILIGDHQQLRPSPTVYELAVHYSLDISLFERMIKNGMTCHQLTQQHRMRPCISSLLTHIYSHLQNHPSVYNYENVLGVAHNMYFINHSYKESSISDTDSYSNIHEAKFLVALCRYLRHQRYEASQITVLTTYSGQLFLLKRLMKGDSLFEKVRVTVVDNFQGEENDIILLSFVRSNDKGSIGFLKVSNRVCVALSRAKKGLYCIGNFDLLAKESTLWENIIGNVQAQGIIGQSLALTCQNHPETITNVQVAEDFLNYVPDGGCTKPCTFVMDCGHICTRSCHPYDLDHTAFKCKEDCLKMCDQGHKCKKPCFKECGKCMVPVEKLIPRCGHRQLVPCHLDSNEFACPVVCNKMLPCGHFCSKACYKACDPCVKMTRRKFNCGHCVDILCSENTADLTCPTLCNRKLSCGHYCKGECGIVPCPPCMRRVKKQLPCGHEREIICSEFLVKNIDICNLACAKLLDCKHKCQRMCGHKGVCGPCRQPCKRRLLCGDKCRLKCSETCPQLCKTCKPVQQQNLHLNMNGVTKWGNSLGNLYGKKSLPFDYNFFIE